jgi:hypothetical protein
VLLCVQDAFYRAVPPGLLPDYAQVVPLERQMWLERIKQRVSQACTGLLLSQHWLCNATHASDSCVPHQHAIMHPITADVIDELVQAEAHMCCLFFVTCPVLSLLFH